MYVCMYVCMQHCNVKHHVCMYVCMYVGSSSNNLNDRERSVSMDTSSNHDNGQAHGDSPSAIHTLGHTSSPPGDGDTPPQPKRKRRNDGAPVFDTHFRMTRADMVNYLSVCMVYVCMYVYVCVYYV